MFSSKVKFLSTSRGRCNFSDTCESDDPVPDVLSLCADLVEFLGFGERGREVTVDVVFRCCPEDCKEVEVTGVADGNVAEGSKT